MSLPKTVSAIYDHRWRASLATYAESLSGGKWRSTAFHRYMARQVQVAVAKGGARLIITTPPRHGKSELCSHWLPTWFLDWFPDRHVILTSYGDSLASSFSRKVRDELRHNEKTITKVRTDSAAVDEWHTQDGGGMMAAGVGGPITGKGGDLLLLDDPHKSWEEAMSPTYRQKVIDWFMSTFYTRAEPGASIVVVMTRWHENDLAGYLLEKQPDVWTHIKLPAIAEDEDEMGREPGTALCPERYTVADLLTIRDNLAPLMWDALFQQRPTRIGGNLVQRDWWRFWDKLPDRFDGIIQSWDATFKKTTSGSFVVGQLWGLRAPLRYLIDERRGRWDFKESIDQIRSATEAWAAQGLKAQEILVEDKANGSAIVSVLRDELEGVRECAVEGGDKVARLLAETPVIARGQMLLPNPLIRPWVNDYMDELERFPAEPNDRGDATSQALSYFRNNYMDDCGVY